MLSNDPNKNQLLVKELFGEDASYCMARLAICESENSANIDGYNITRSVVAGALIPNMAKCDDWELWECDVILIPRRKFEGSPRPFGNATDQMLNTIASPESWRKQTYPKKEAENDRDGPSKNKSSSKKSRGKKRS